MTDAVSRCRRWVDRYLELVNTGRYREMGDLFASGCTYLHSGAGAALREPEEIGAFYERFLSPRRSEVQIGFWVDDGDRAAFELMVRLPGEEEYRLTAMDSVTLDADDKACRFASFPFEARAS